MRTVLTVPSPAPRQLCLQEQESSGSDSSLSQSPSSQEWLAHARTTRCQHRQDSLQRQKVRATLEIRTAVSTEHY